MTEPHQHPMDFDILSEGDYDRLARHLSGESTAVERALTERWILEAPERNSALDALREAWAATALGPVADVDAGWRALSSRLNQAPVTQEIVGQVVSIATARRWWHDTGSLMQVAAAAVLMVGGAIMYPRMRQGIGSDGSVGAGATTAYRTVAGQRRSIDLPDGSRVTLAATSSLRTLPNYGSGAREVELTGEAMFSVTHDEARPFRVHVGSTIVEDLGTEFAVRAVAGEASIRIAVAAGSVAVRGESLSPVVLTPRDVALVSQLGSGADTVVVSHDVDVNRFTAFSLGRLMFVDTPLSQVAIDLSRWYGVTVRITDTALLDRHLTSTFEAETLDEVLRIIGIALDVKYLRDGQSVEFNGSGAISGGSPSPPSSRREAGA